MRAAPPPARTAALLLAVATACGGRLGAQQVVGTVRDSASRQPVAGAVVLLLDSLGRTVGRAISDERGRYRAGPSTDARRMRVLRLGFRPRETGLPVGDADAAIVPVPMLLTEVRVTAAASCPARADRVPALALLEQVRTGLLATIVARTHVSGSMTRLLFERRFDGGSDRIVHQAVRVNSVTGVGGAFSAGRRASDFVRVGFMEDSAGIHTYFAPDAETLIDDGFAAGYCFHLAEPDRVRPHQIGLGFRAGQRRRGRVDVDGTLWVDTLARALHDLEFRYVGLDRTIDALQPGGRISFLSMANGLVLIDRWFLRLVGGVTEVDARTAGMAGMAGMAGNARPPVVRLFAQESGGELARAAWPGGHTHVERLGTLRLRVVSRAGQPAPGIVVRLADTDYQAAADSSGDLVIADLLPGPYAASIVDPRLAALGVALATRLTFVAARDSTVHARLEVETPDDYVARRCAARRPVTGDAWVLGRVAMPDGRPASDARWTVRDTSGAVLAEGGATGADGLLHWCKAASGTTVTVEARRGPLIAQATRVLAERVTVLRLELRPPP